MKTLSLSNHDKVLAENKYKLICVLFQSQYTAQGEEAINEIIKKGKYPRTVFYQCSTTKEKELCEKYKVTEVGAILLILDKEVKQYLLAFFPFSQSYSIAENLSKAIEKYQPDEYQGKGHSIKQMNNTQNFFDMLSKQKPVRENPAPQKSVDKPKPKPKQKVEIIEEKVLVPPKSKLNPEMQEMNRKKRQSLIDDLLLLDIYPKDLIIRVIEQADPNIDIITAEDLCYKTSRGIQIFPTAKATKQEFTDEQKETIEQLIQLEITREEAQSIVRYSTDISECLQLLETRSVNRNTLQNISEEALNAYNLLLSKFSDNEALVKEKGINTSEKAKAFLQPKPIPEPKEQQRSSSKTFCSTTNKYSNTFCCSWKSKKM